MSVDQKAPYTPKPITQRDGSALANSNCRMASIATGLDYDTKGAKTSTGAKMRSYTSDQSGGTDSSDAKQAWDRGYSEVLTVRDGNTFDNLLADLVDNRAVHIDVWHATVGGPCLSGSGGYGHTMFVLPDCSGGAWLVADPWCNPPKFTRVSESKLRAGAEAWGRKVFDTAGVSRTRTRDLNDEERKLIAEAARRLMSAFHAGGDEDPTGPLPETSGPQRILYTVTNPLTAGGGGGEMSGDYVIYDADADSRRTGKVAEGTPFFNDWQMKDQRGAFSGAATVQVFGYRSSAYAVQVHTGQGWSDGTARTTLVFVAQSKVTGIVVSPPPATDCDAAVADAVTARDAEWETALEHGDPWPNKE